MAGTENDRAASIMVVDDDQRNVRLMESILRSNGYRVQHAFNGLEAKQLIETEEPDLLLLDVMMPKMNGFELCRALRQTHRTRLLPIIMGASMLIQQRMTPMTGMDPVQARMMTTVMPLMMTVLFYQFPSGLVLYWMVSNFLGIGHQLWVRRGMEASAS